LIREKTASRSSDVTWRQKTSGWYWWEKGGLLVDKKKYSGLSCSIVDYGKCKDLKITCTTKRCSRNLAVFGDSMNYFHPDSSLCSSGDERGTQVFTVWLSHQSRLLSPQLPKVNHTAYQIPQLGRAQWEYWWQMNGGVCLDLVCLSIPQGGTSGGWFGHISTSIKMFSVNYMQLGYF